MKISVGSYNLFDGAQDAYARLVRFVTAQNFDILCLQEVNGWQNDEYKRVREFLDQVGYRSYAFGDSNTQFKLATFSRLPITAQSIHTIGFWHCVVEIHVSVGNTDVAIFNLHLNPWNEESRLQEIDHLLPKIDRNKATIITGDLNSISRQDNYPATFHNELIKHGIIKYGQADLEFRVIETLENAGFIDAAVKLNAIQPTVPTPSANDRDHELPVRIDYMLVSAPLQNAISNFTTIKTEETNIISDHYPICVDITLDDAAPTPTPEVQQETQIAPKYEEPVPEHHNTNTEGEIDLH